MQRDDGPQKRPPLHGPLLHGGDRAPLRRLAQVPEARWLDLSTGINPWPYPLPALPAACWQRLPEAGAATALETAARRFYAVPDTAGFAAAPGSQALIQWLPRLLPPGRVAVLDFTYQEHGRSWAAAGHEVAVAEDGEPPADAEVVVTVNPNNPDGRRRDPAALRALADRLARRDGLLVVDEAFAEVAPELSLAPDCDRPGLLVLRSFGKFFGLAGLRLGCALGAPALAGRLAEAIGPWALPGPTLEIAARAFADDAWTAATRARLQATARRLDALLEAAGLAPCGGTDLFRLAEHPEAGILFERLCRAGILVRRFPDRPAWLRFGLPPDAEAEERLAAALRD